MTEAEIWREKARAWCFQADDGSDWFITAMLKNLAIEAARLADEIERGQARRADSFAVLPPAPSR